MCYFQISDVCQKFKIVVLNSNESYFEGSIVLNEILNYNEKQLHQLKLIAFVRLLVLIFVLLH